MWKPCRNSTVDVSHLHWQHKSRSVTQRVSSGAFLVPEKFAKNGNSRLVFRGDDCKEMKSLPATVNMVLYHGMRPNIKVEISDATKAYYIFKHPRTVKVLHLCFVGNYCQGFHDANFVYILISFMFSSCVDILSIGSSVLLKNPGRNEFSQLVCMSS